MINFKKKENDSKRKICDKDWSKEISKDTDKSEKSFCVIQ